MRTLESVFLLILSSVIIAAATMVGYKVPLMDTFIGVSVLLIVGLTGFLISRLPMLNKLPSVVWISVVAIFVSTSVPNTLLVPPMRPGPSGPSAPSPIAHSAGWPQLGQLTCFHVGWRSSGLPGMSNDTSSGSVTGS